MEEKFQVKFIWKTGNFTQIKIQNVETYKQ
jgi:hypothetical protein